MKKLEKIGCFGVVILLIAFAILTPLVSKWFGLLLPGAFLFGNICNWKASGKNMEQFVSDSLSD
jgi:hypothetical protein